MNDISKDGWIPYVIMLLQLSPEGRSRNRTLVNNKISALLVFALLYLHAPREMEGIMQTDEVRG